MQFISVSPSSLLATPRVRLAVKQPAIKLPSKSDIRIVGIDPGSRVTGIAVVQFSRQSSTLLCGKNIQLKGSVSERLFQLWEQVCATIREYDPHEAAIEKVFLAQNPSSAIKLGQARGVALAAIASQAVLAHEYAATRIKNTIVGYGRADKHQVQAMVMRELKLAKTLPSDASDAAAIALTHGHLRLQPQIAEGAQV